MFKEGTSLTGKTPTELISEDFKIFTIDEDKIGIAQVYTMDPESLKDMKSDLLSLMKDRIRNEGYSTFIVMLTDIFKQASEMIVVGENKDLIAKSFGKTIENNSFYAKGVLSRKKQVVPPIMNAITNIEEL
ncbi:DHHA2 domain-containing protein, partial [Senegalia sp. (in: firmicutes)]|uniref:DHHA2 domain-containing protein n=2 Tax=Senegalia sp. (in: firmicutes) TaxID=1924098 RepID=UPI003F9A655A